MEMMKAAAEAHSAMRLPKPADHVSSVVPEAIPGISKQRTTLPMRDNSKAPAPPLTLLKRVNTPQEKSMKADLLLKSAISALEAGNLSTAERLLDKCEQRISKASVTHNHYYGGNDDDDNSTFTDTWSEAADAASPENNADADDDDDDDDDFDKRIRKASYHHRIQGGAEPLPEPSKGTPMRSGDSSDTYNISTTPATRTASAHKFDRLVEHVQERDGCSKNEAMATARREYPDVYTSYQASVADSPTSAQHTRRAGRGVSKRMPDTFEDLVSAEMQKGVSWRIAEQRVINTHGSTALNNRMIKRDGGSVATEFTKRASGIMWDDSVDRCEALRRLRKEQPWLYDALNSS
jgi:hypothetical protein